MVTRMRIAKRGPFTDGADMVAGILLVITIAAMLVPARFGFDRSPWVKFYNGGHTVVWLAALLFLLDHARREKNLRSD